MKFGDIDNLWTIDLAKLSRLDQGRVFVERAKVVLDAAIRTGDFELEGRKIRRSWFARKIGCTLGTASQNRRIKGLLDAADATLMSVATLRHELAVTGSNNNSPSDVLRSPDRDFAPATSHNKRRHLAEAGVIVLSDASCKIGGHPHPNIPTILWSDGIDEPASDWLRDVVVKYRLAPSSALEYAEILRLFLRRCRKRRRHWTTVDDAFLVAWRDDMEHLQKLSRPRINNCLDTVFAFYYWAELTRRLRYHVAIYERPSLPDPLTDTTFAISAKRSESRRRRGTRTKGLNGSRARRGKLAEGWSTPLRISVPKQTVGARHTPTEEQVRKLHDLAIDRANGERDSLLLSWAEETGGRRAEILQIKRSDLPTIDQLDNLIADDTPWQISVIRKGGNRGSLLPLADLLIRTLDYIQFERERIVERCRGAVGYSEPDEVFLSTSTGQVLHPDSVTSLTGQLFRTAGIKKASYHRLRAKHLLETVDALVEALSVGGKPLSADTILLKAAEHLGVHPESLRPYLNYALQRRIRASEAIKFQNLSSRIRQLELRQAVLRTQVSATESLRSAAHLIQSGKAAEAATLLRSVADALAK